MLQLTDKLIQVNFTSLVQSPTFLICDLLWYINSVWICLTVSYLASRESLERFMLNVRKFELCDLGLSCFVSSLIKVLSKMN